MTRLELPQNTRAIQLYEDLNQRYLHFVADLPPSLGQLAKKKSTYLGGPDSHTFRGLSELNPVLASTPWLFWETFSSIEDGAFLEIAEAGMAFVLASIVLDHLVDGQVNPMEETALLHQALYGHGIAKYNQVMPSTAPFWKHFERFSKDHLTGLSTEVDLQSGLRQIDLEDLFVMAHGKVSPILTTIAALVFTSNQPEILAPIESSLKHIAVASQLLDDVGDWEHDLKVGHYTYFLACLVPHESWSSGNPPSVVELRVRLEQDWNDVEHLRLVMKWLNASLESVANLDCPAWVSYVQGYQDLTDENLSNVLGHHLIHKLHPLVNNHLKRKGNPKEGTPNDDLVI